MLRAGGAGGGGVGADCVLSAHFWVAGVINAGGAGILLVCASGAEGRSGDETVGQGKEEADPGGSAGGAETVCFTRGTLPAGRGVAEGEVVASCAS